MISKTTDPVHFSVMRSNHQSISAKSGKDKIDCGVVLLCQVLVAWREWCLQCPSERFVVWSTERQSALGHHADINIYIHLGFRASHPLWTFAQWTAVAFLSWVDYACGLRRPLPVSITLTCIPLQGSCNERLLTCELVHAYEIQFEIFWLFGRGNLFWLMFTGGRDAWRNANMFSSGPYMMHYLNIQSKWCSISQLWVNGKWCISVSTIINAWLSIWKHHWHWMQRLYPRLGHSQVLQWGCWIPY